MATEPEIANTPLMALDREDQEFVLRLVLASGSLKDLAAHYGVSYPTIRARLDRVIDRLRLALAGKQADPMADLLATLVERGQLGAKDARRILDTHRERLRRSREDEE